MSDDGKTFECPTTGEKRDSLGHVVPLPGSSTMFLEVSPQPFDGAQSAPVSAGGRGLPLVFCHRHVIHLVIP